MLKQSLRHLLCFIVVMSAAASSVDPKAGAVTPPTATVKVLEANYCFAKFHALVPERLPMPPLVLRVRFQVDYHAAGNRPLILPLDHELTVWMSQGPGVMKILHQPGSVFDPTVKLMTRLPEVVSPDNPVDPTNEFFAIIPAGGDMIAPTVEEVTVQIYKKSPRQKIDLRGRRVYLKMQLDHQQLAPGLEAELSDRWSKFGAPWTGGLRTNTLIFDVPVLPEANECVDIGNPHPAKLKLSK